MILASGCILVLNRNQSNLDLDKINIVLNLLPLSQENDNKKTYLMMYEISSELSDVNIKDISLEINTNKSYIKISKLEENDERATKAFSQYAEVAEKNKYIFFMVDYLNQEEFDEEFNYQDFTIDVNYKHKKYIGEINVVRMLAV